MVYCILLGIVPPPSENIWEYLQHHVTRTTCVVVDHHHDDRDDDATTSSIEWRQHSIVIDNEVKDNNNVEGTPTLIVTAVVGMSCTPPPTTEDDDENDCPPDAVVKVVQDALNNNKSNNDLNQEFTCEMWATAPAPLPLRPFEGYSSFEEEKVRQRLSDENGSNAAVAATRHTTTTVMREWGMVLQKNVLNAVQIQQLRLTIVDAVIEEMETAIRERHPTIQLGKDHFWFTEIASRNQHRFDVLLLETKYAETTKTFVNEHILNQPHIRQFVHRCLACDDFDNEIDYDCSVVYSRPGASHQLWHADGNHMPNSQDAGWSVDGYKTQLSDPYAVCLFIPLIDLSEEVGYTQFWPGSHRYKNLVGFGKVAELGNGCATYDGAINSKAGDGLWYDYRLLHRGMPNTSRTTMRPVLQIIFKYKWYIDKSNFGKESVYINKSSSTSKCATTGNANTAITSTTILPLLLLKDPTLLFEYSPDSNFQCGETVDEDGDVGSISFWCTIPRHAEDGCENISNNNSTKLTFSCRDKSVGVLSEQEKATNDEDNVNEEEEEEGKGNTLVDPNFFDSGYTLAGRTGFQIWAGSRLLIESLAIPDTAAAASSGLHPRLVEWQNRIARGTNVIELGAGVGLLGASLAACGAEVLLTDLPTLVDNAIRPNLARNESQKSRRGEQTIACPRWLSSSSSSSSDPGAEAVPIGRGWANATALDWTRPVHEQLSTEQLEAVDLIVASDCVWLSSMLDGLLDTVESIFTAAVSSSNARPPPSFLMSFQQRDSQQSGGDSSSGGMFTTVDTIIDAIKKRTWDIDCLAWRPITLTNDDDTTETKEVFVFEITNAQQNNDEK